MPCGVRYPPQTCLKWELDKSVHFWCALSFAQMFLCVLLSMPFYTCLHIYIYTHNIYIYIYLYTFTSVCAYSCVLVHIPIHTSVCISLSEYICCIYIFFLYIYVYILKKYTYMYIQHRQRQWRWKCVIIKYAPLSQVPTTSDFRLFSKTEYVNPLIFV